LYTELFYAAWKQGRDDSIKEFSTQLHSTYLWCGKIWRVRLYTELFYAIIPTLFLAFCWSAIPTSCYIFNVFLLF